MLCGRHNVTIFNKRVIVNSKYFYSLRGRGGTFGSNQGNEFEYLSDRGGHGGHLAEKFLKKCCSYPELSRLPCRDLPVVTRQQLAIRVIISK